MKRLLFVAAMLMVSGMAFAADAEKAAAPELPDAVLGVIEALSLQTLQDHLQAYVGSIAPGQNAAMGLGMLVGRITKSTNPGIAEYDRPVRLLLVKAGPGTISAVRLFMVKDATAYRGTLIPMLKKAGEKDGIALFTEERREFDRRAYARAKPEERQDFQRFMKTVREPVAIGEAERTMCIAGDPAVVKAVLELVKAGKLPDRILGADGDVAAFIKVKALMDYLTTPEGGPLRSWRQSVKEMMAMAQPGGGAAIASILDAELDAVESVGAQVEVASGRMSVDAQDIRASLAVEAVPETPLAAYLASVPRGVPDTLKYLPEDAFLVASLKLGDLKPATESMLELRKKIVAASAAPPDKSAEFDNLTRETIAAYGDELTFAMRGGERFRIVEAIRMKDPALVETVSRKMPDLFNATMSGIYRNMGMEMKMEGTPEPVVYNGHAIWQRKVAFGMKAPEAGNEPAAQQAAAAQKAISALFGDGLTMDSTVLEKDWIMSMGPDSLKTLQLIADGRQPKLTETPAFKKALASVPADAQGIVFVHLTDLADFWLSLARIQMGAGMPQFQFERGPGVVGCLAGSGSTATLDARIPAAEIKALADGFKNAGGPPQGPVGAPAPAALPPPPPPEPVAPIAPAQPG